MCETNCDFAINTQDYYHHFGFDIFLDKSIKPESIFYNGLCNKYYEFNNKKLYLSYHSRRKPNYSVSEVIEKDIHKDLCYGYLHECETFIIEYFSKNIPNYFPFKINFIFQ